MIKHPGPCKRSHVVTEISERDSEMIDPYVINYSTRLDCLLDKFDYRVAGSTDIALRVCNLEVLGDVDIVSLVPEFSAYEFVATAGDET